MNLLIAERVTKQPPVDVIHSSSYELQKLKHFLIHASRKKIRHEPYRR